ncbi:MAG: hypothetical protein ACOY2B_02220 [Pseudomonadota bacterium]
MFTGSVPVAVIQQLLEVVPFAEWGDAYCCCSGSFRVDGAIKRRFPLAQVHSNDVSLLSCGLGAVLVGGGFPLRFHGRLEFVEGHVDTFQDRVAAVLVCLEMAKYKAGNDYAVTHFGEYRENFDKLLAFAKATVTRFTEGVSIDSFTPVDFRAHAKRGIEAGAGIVAWTAGSRRIAAGCLAKPSSRRMADPTRTSPGLMPN